MAPSPIVDSHNSDDATLSDALQAISLNDAEQPPDTENARDKLNATRPLRIYTRAQLLNLHRSPLVQPPPDMPELKIWFGTENEQNLAKKDIESTPTGSRDRRFRRDYDESEATSRPSFRSTLTQPSQMGNFKHQSLRDRDKDRDRDGERDRERDLRDREGQERLRHLSDKYDRDRLNLAANTRAKDRDSAGSARTTAQSQPSTNPSRRGEIRDPSKRKPNESGDDWRRAADLSRTNKEDRSDTTRRERDRSRIRDSSRSRPEASSRRDRIADREDGRERSNRDRDDPRRDRDEDEDGRHWRDDGKRDERVAARKARERGGDHWEPSSDRRWAATEERESRYKRGNGREKRTDDVRDRDDRKDREREREREKEKEPAWMETYVPTEPLSGILGGVGSTGELDGIQAWKKGMKDKERAREKEGAIQCENDTKADANRDELSGEDAKGDSGQPMDEIQLFRLMMQKAKERPNSQGVSPSESASLPSNLISVTPDPKLKDPGLEAHAETSKQTQGSDVKFNLHPDTPSSGGQSNTVSRMAAFESSAITVTSSEQPTHASPIQFNPPAGPRLLALGRGNKQPAVQSQHPQPGLASPQIEAVKGIPAGYFDEVGHQRSLTGRITPNGTHLPETLHRAPMNHSPLNHTQQLGQGILDSNQIDANGTGHVVPKGSRFAKFFDGKPRDAPSAKVQTPSGFIPPSPSQGQRFDQGNFGGPSNSAGEQRTMDDIIAMLANSQVNRAGQNVNINSGLPSLQPGSNYNGHTSHHALHQPHLNPSRPESLYDSRLDDRSFVPDGMVPGLRTALPHRSRDNFPEPAEDPILHLQRVAHHQHLQQRADPIFSGAVNATFSAQQPQPRGVGLPPPGQPFRGGPSPNSAQQLGMASRAMPPGLANLGSRPPHEASQFLGLPGGPQLNTLANNGQLHQQQFAAFNNGNINNLGFANLPQFRGPLPSMSAQNAGGPLTLSNLAQSNVDPRLAAQGFALGGPAGSVAAGQRGLPPHQRLGHQVQAPHLGIRPQQQGQLPPHMLPHNTVGQGPTNQPAQDLMALLMGGTLRNE